MKKTPSSPVAIFRALANPARLCIVRELGMTAERCVCELVECCGLGWSTVSHHLSILKQAGIVTDEKRGQQVFYRIAMPCVVHFIRCLETPEGIREFEKWAGCRFACKV